MSLERDRIEGNGEVRYVVRGNEGAIDFHVMNKEVIPGWGRSGGVEIHSATPMNYAPDAACSHRKCWALKGRPCWHDGSSLWASEYWIPMLERHGEEFIFDRLEDEYHNHFLLTDNTA